MNKVKKKTALYSVCMYFQKWSNNKKKIDMKFKYMKSSM